MREQLIEVIKNEGIVVMLTDTIYGVVGDALNEKVVSKIYSLKGRNPSKPCIILIGDMSELEKFGVTLTSEQKEIAKKYWSSLRPTSIIFDCTMEEFSYLHRGTNTLAFRLPSSDIFCDLLKHTGPLLAPSANPEGMVPAKNIIEARQYFGESVDLYVDELGFEKDSNDQKPSRLIRLNKDGTADIIRE